MRLLLLLVLLLGGCAHRPPSSAAPRALDPVAIAGLPTYGKAAPGLIKVAVTGEGVVHPGYYWVGEGLSVSAAISTAGGFSAHSPRVVYLRRGYQRADTIGHATFSFDFSSPDASRAAAWPLENGDSLSVGNLTSGESRSPTRGQRTTRLPGRLWLIIGAPEQEFGPGESFDLKLFWPVDPKQLPKELAGIDWPPKETA